MATPPIEVLGYPFDCTQIRTSSTTFTSPLGGSILTSPFGVQLTNAIEKVNNRSSICQNRHIVICSNPTSSYLCNIHYHDRLQIDWHNEIVCGASGSSTFNIINTKQGVQISVPDKQHLAQALTMLLTQVTSQVTPIFVSVASPQAWNQIMDALSDAKKEAKGVAEIFAKQYVNMSNNNYHMIEFPITFLHELLPQTPNSDGGHTESELLCFRKALQYEHAPVFAVKEPFQVKLDCPCSAIHEPLQQEPAATTSLPTL